MLRHKNAVLILATCTAIVFLAACDSGASSSRPEGLYRISSVNGQSLPYTFDNVQGTTVLQAGSVALDASGTFQFILQYTFQAKDQTNVVQRTNNEIGSWQISGTELMVTWSESGTVFSASNVSDGSIDLTMTWYPDIALAMHFEK